jgi:hypothetical protein
MALAWAWAWAWACNEFRVATLVSESHTLLPYLALSEERTQQPEMARAYLSIYGCPLERLPVHPQFRNSTPWCTGQPAYAGAKYAYTKLRVATCRLLPLSRSSVIA